MGFRVRSLRSRPGMTDLMSLTLSTSASTQVPQCRLDHLALLGGQCGLRRDRIADVIALHRQAGLDTGGEVVTRKSFVDAPEPALQLHRLVPALLFAELIELDALPRDDAGRSRHPPDA